MTKSEILAKLLGSECHDEILNEHHSLHRNCGGVIQVIRRTSNGETYTLLECQRCLAWDKFKDEP